MLAACTWDGDPIASVRGLSHFPTPTLSFRAHPRQVSVSIETDPHEARACAVLEDGFQATVNGVAMEITSGGEAIDSIQASSPCRPPTLRLDNPPTGADLVIAISYPSHAMLVDLADLMVPRAAELVPAGPWVFRAGQVITLQWSRTEDLGSLTPMVRFVTDDSPQTGIRYFYLQAGVDGDRLTFALPTVTYPGKLEVAMQESGGDIIKWPRCAGARCELHQTPQWVQPITWQAAAGEK